ncbi:helix-turn-helix transcriptional regulator [Paenibacillus sacheonensis]|uniref:Helix-turn-helix domain-containing protein n=1 Tax=Paenibacillus sacheonensis TaxID=742054 RepID=A0A7X5BZ02_9BACL|nr:AraC family transcriptional regulator [Paenibacillus sacheonensis]MBM7568455.1 AraC-like DNA-binding protein/quercetin dioxygenase-like cupin family protein [Paenibacillus sacheonensis]NBC72153.1 helix-turn-helix domain-containing protein [Paenibacillus sacheonensis]
MTAGTNEGVAESELRQDGYFPPHVVLAHQFVASESWRMPERILKYHQFQYMTEGEGCIQVEDRVYDVKQGDLVYIPPHVPHASWKRPASPFACISVSFHFGDAQEPPLAYMGRTVLFAGVAELPVHRRLRRLVAFKHQPGLASIMECQAELLGVLAELSRLDAEGDAGNHERKRNAGAVLQIKNHLLEHYREPLRLVDLEKLTGFSPNYVIRLFKDATGMTPFQYVRWARLQKALELAFHTPMTVGEIAAHVGYADVHAFGKMFKKSMGSTLSAYRDGMFL